MEDMVMGRKLQLRVKLEIEVDTYSTYPLIVIPEIIEFAKTLPTGAVVEVDFDGVPAYVMAHSTPMEVFQHHQHDKCRAMAPVIR